MSIRQRRATRSPKRPPAEKIFQDDLQRAEAEVRTDLEQRWNSTNVQQAIAKYRNAHTRYVNAYIRNPSEVESAKECLQVHRKNLVATYREGQSLSRDAASWQTLNGGLNLSHEPDEKTRERHDEYRAWRSTPYEELSKTPKWGEAVEHLCNAIKRALSECQTDTLLAKEPDETKINQTLEDLQNTYDHLKQLSPNGERKQILAARDAIISLRNQLKFYEFQLEKNQFTNPRFKLSSAEELTQTIKQKLRVTENYRELLKNSSAEKPTFKNKAPVTGLQSLETKTEAPRISAFKKLQRYKETTRSPHQASTHPAIPPDSKFATQTYHRTAQAYLALKTPTHNYRAYRGGLPVFTLPRQTNSHTVGEPGSSSNVVFGTREPLHKS